MIFSTKQIILKPTKYLVFLSCLSFSFFAHSIDPAKIMGPDECTECHDVENSAWESTHHYSTFEEMPEQDEALKIAEKLGIDDVVESENCQSCHITMQSDGEEAEAIAGVSCESCHGGAADWMDIHSEEDKAADQADAIWAKAESKGMIRPSNLTSLAANCLDCHLVNDPDLVNKGGHEAGSKFNLVTWSQGEVRHNTFHSENGENRLASKQKLRKMYVIGSTLELQKSLLAYSKSSDKSTDFAKAMLNRIEKTKAEIAQLPASDPLFASLQKVSASVPKSSLEENKSLANELMVLAKKVEKASSDPWGSIDKLISDLGPYKGTAQE